MAGRPITGSLNGYDSFEVRLGDELRGERATLGKSLLDVQRDLRIKAAYIAAIENCDTSVFQNKGFVAGYVRSYARYLNLDADTIFARFSDEAKFGGVNEGMNPKTKTNSKVRGIKRSKKAETAMLVHPALRNRALNTSPFVGVSASGIGSVLVLAVLIAGLGFGGWSVLQDIQRVQLVPVDQTPGASAVVTPPIQPEIETAATILQSGRSSDLLFSRLYRPKELAVPVLEHRDGPIAGIDPDRGGLFSDMSQRESTEISSLVAQATSELASSTEPQLVAASTLQTVSVFATSPAWIRVYLADGSRVFEKILETGEAYVLPADIQAPLLRAGNSGAVFLSVGGSVFGPIGQGTAIAKEVSLDAADIRSSWPLSVDQEDMAAQIEQGIVDAPLAAITPVTTAEGALSAVPNAQ